MDHASYPLDVKSLNDAGRIEGLAAGYGNVDAYQDVFAPGAFAKAISGSGRQPVMLLHHDHKRPVGSWSSFEETDDGLHVVGKLALAVADAKEAYELLKARVLTGLSVGYLPRKTGPTKDNPPGVRRLITEAELLEVSLVSVPANPKTWISGVKSVGSVRDLEDHLREIGLSGRRAKAAAAAAFRSANDQPDEAAADAELAALFADSTARLSAL